MKRLFRIFLLTVFLTGLWQPAPGPVSAAPCLQPADCAVPEQPGRQRQPSEMITLFEQAAKNEMGEGGPTLPKMVTGLDGKSFSNPYVPCIILQAAAYQESGWKQYRAAFGQEGLTLIASDCGYGVMQITTGMRIWEQPPTTFDRKRVAENTRYNLGTGALFFITKWNAIQNVYKANVGQNNPLIVEDWYYAVWAYNGLADSNNPNDTRYNNPDRPPFTGYAEASKWWYPYQERIWGYAAHPPSIGDLQQAWAPVELTLPPRSAFPSIMPRDEDNIMILPDLEQITPYHYSCILPAALTVRHYAPLMPYESPRPAVLAPDP